MQKIYDKLVRDKISKIIENDHKTCDIEILSDEKHLTMVDAKRSVPTNNRCLRRSGPPGTTFSPVIRYCGIL